MRKIKIDISSSYDILIGKGLMSSVGSFLKEAISPCRIMLISDTNVFPIYGQAVISDLEKNGYTVHSYIIEAGEASKNYNNLSDIWETLASLSFSRSDAILALGGGVVGDLSGFAAATYMRGIKYASVATSLLAMVDSSVGGKCAVDLKNGKNLAGAFYQPSLVICDTDALNTLPRDIYSDGMAEVIKYGMISSDTILDILTRDGDGDIEELVYLSVTEKKKAVEQDEFDRGVRQLLNFGHTPAHAIEALSSYGISHGRAVGIGMYIMTRYAEAAGLVSPSVTKTLRDLLDRFGLDTVCPYTASELAKKAAGDKKAHFDKITLVVPVSYGRSELLTLPIASLSDVFERGML